TWYNMSMIITLIILALLVWAYFVGQSRGLALQLFYTFGSLIAIFIALANYKTLAEKITLWVPFASATVDSKLSFYPAKLLFEIDHVFYALVAFLIIYAVVYAGLRLIGIFLGALESMIIFGAIGNVIAGILSVCAVFFGLSLALMVLSTVPLALVQNQLYASGIARFMLEQTPIFSSWLQHTFITDITKINL
ncbi:MAG: CvpA family protein, partial [Lactococcus sp.]|nr:CvpA family protein [Lactococcus sp.]